MRISILVVLLLSMPMLAQVLQIPRGQSILADGVLSAGEWADAGTLVMQLEDGREITVRYKHDGKNLNFAFEKLGSGETVVFPELLIDPSDKKSKSWEPGQWWLHASANDCEGNGAFNIYQVDGEFACSKEKPGWVANNYPNPNQVIEISVGFDKLAHQKQFGFALDLTNTRDLWVYWPQTARIESPKTWGQARLKD